MRPALTWQSTSAPRNGPKPPFPKWQSHEVNLGLKLLDANIMSLNNNLNLLKGQSELMPHFLDLLLSHRLLQGAYYA